MATNLSINMELLDTALEVGGFKTKRETVDQALREFIQRRRSAEILDLFGKVEYDDDYDYKATRLRGQ